VSQNAWISNLALNASNHAVVSVFENQVLKIFAFKEVEVMGQLRKLHNENLYDFHSSLLGLCQCVLDCCDSVLGNLE
jgi:hypothetical protein